MKKAVVLLSGGLDSATTLAIAQEQEYACYALSIDYEQRHAAELKAAQAIANARSVLEHKVVTLDIGSLLTGSNALTDKQVDVPQYQPSEEIPVTYVPARNTIFLSIALAWTEVLGANDIFFGANVVDYSNYPDCRTEYIQAFMQMSQLATKVGVEQGVKVHIHAPLISLDKADIIKQGVRLGLDYSLTVSCYQATKEGYACGQCDSCHFRREGFAQAGIDDPTRYRA